MSKKDRNHCLHGIYILVAGERNTSTKSMSKLCDMLESINAMGKINQRRRKVCKFVESWWRLGRGDFISCGQGKAQSPDLSEM